METIIEPFRIKSVEQFGNSAYLVLDKLTEEDDASVVYRQAGAIKWEVGATTELSGNSSDLHVKRGHCYIN